MNPSLPLGIVVGDRYRLLQVVGYGSLGYTYLAEVATEKSPSRWLLKELLPLPLDSARLQQARQDFARRTTKLYRLQHPQLPRFRELILVLNHEGGRLLLPQDFIEGTPYSRILTARRQQNLGFSELEVRLWLLHLLPVLDYLHRAGLTHQALSLNNVLLRHGDALPVPVAFGLIKEMAIAVQSQIALPAKDKSVAYLSEIGFIPPEQARGRQTGPHSDLYALAIASLVLLTGRDAHQLRESDPASGHWQRYVALSPAFSLILSRMLAADPQSRFQSVQELLQALTKEPGPIPPVVRMQSLRELSKPSEELTLPPPELQEATTILPTIAPLSEMPTQGTAARPSASAGTVRQPLFGCLSKVPLLIALIVGSGLLGWLGGRAWVVRFGSNNEFEQPSSVAFPPSEETAPVASATLPAGEQRRQTDLQRRRQQLNIDEGWFVELVNRSFWEQHPELKGRALTAEAGDRQWREDWDRLAADYLERLSRLSGEARRNLGRYNQAHRERWKTGVNALHLSSRAFYDLVDGEFLGQYPELTGQNLRDLFNQPLGQVWNAIAVDKLRDLQAGTGYEELDLSAGSVARRGRLEPGGGQAFVVNLPQGQTLTVELEAGEEVLLSLYSPTGSVQLLEDSPERSWSGVLPESGFYELAIVSSGKRPLDYQLQLTIKIPEAQDW
ncbi:MAG: protein kinase [Chloroflexaceae bacterium]|nr:protein kinase [Chloroflexaceae bacterium]